MHIHKSVVTKWQSPKGETIPFNETDFTDYNAAKNKIEQLKKEGNKRVFITQRDSEYIGSEFLINAINSAFKSWEESPWKKAYSFETFCEYILPYRNSTEPLKFGWRDEAKLSYQIALHNATDPNEPSFACSALIDELALIEFKYDDGTIQPLLSIEQMNFRKEGSCPDLANNVLLIARSLGIATTYDYTPFHAASSNAHFWNTVIDSEGESIPFNGNLKKPYEYDTSIRRIGKALRLTFSSQPTALVNNVPSNLIAVESLGLPNTIDVTDKYVDAYTIEHTYNEKPLEGLGYLCVYNRGYWRPTWWGLANEQNKVQFTKMGSNLIYLPASVQQLTSKHGRTSYDLNYEPYPLLLDSKGKTTVLKPNFKKRFKATLSRKNETVFGEREFNTLEMENGTELELQYWENGWQSLGKHTVKNQSILVKKVPTNALFRLLPQNPDGFERIFTILKDGFQILWY